MESIHENLPERKGPPPIPPEARKRKEAPPEEESFSLEELISARLKKLEAETAPEALEAEGEAAIAASAQELGLAKSDIEEAKKNVGYGEQKSGIFDKIREIGKSAILGLKSRLSSKEAAPPVVEGESVKEEVKLLEEESKNLELTNKKIVGSELAKLKEAKEKGQITAEEYKQKRAEIAESRKFQYLVRMEQAIRDAEAFVIQNPDISKEEIVKTVVENSENKIKLNATQKKAVEKAADNYVNSRKSLVQYVESLPKGIYETQSPNPLDALESNPVAKKQLLLDIGFTKEYGINPEDVIIKTDFPVAVGIEFKDPQKMFALMDKKFGGKLSEGGGDAETTLGLFLVSRFSKLHKGEKSKQVSALDDAVYLINGAAKEKEAAKKHEIQHHIFNKFILPEKELLRREKTVDEETLLAEKSAVDEFAAYLKTGTYQYNPTNLFRFHEGKIRNGEENDPLVKSFKKIKAQLRRLETSGLNASDLYTLVETSDGLDEMGRRLELVPSSGLKTEKLLFLLSGEAFTKEGVDQIEAAQWILDQADSGQKINFTDELIERVGGLLLPVFAKLDAPSENDLKVMKEMADKFERAAGKKYKPFELAIASMKDRLKGAA